MPRLNLENIIASVKIAIDNSDSIETLNSLSKEFLGNNYLISEERKTLSLLSENDKKKFGTEINEVTKK